MATPPTTRPETWVPAGAEGAKSSKTAPPTGMRPSGRRPTVALPLRGRKRTRRSPRELLGQVAGMALEAAIPWMWFLVRDLGSAMQLVALVLPAVIGAVILGLIVALFDGRKLTTVVVLGSVVAFGWVAVLGPASAQPSPVPTYPVRVAAVSLPGAGGNMVATLTAISRTRADVTILVEPSKKARANLMSSAHAKYVFQRGSFVVLSTFPVRELALPTSLTRAPILRLQVDRPKDPFVVYAVGASGSVFDTATSDQLRLGALEKAARGERLPVVLAGDFGMSDRSTGYRDLTGSGAGGFRDALRAGTRAGGTLRSFPWSALVLRVNYVLTSRSWCAAGGRTFDVPASGQAGVTASVGPCLS